MKIQVILIILQFCLCNFLNIVLLSFSFIESESFASFYNSQKGSKKSEAQIMALEKRKLDMLLDNVDAPRALMLPIISDVPKTKHCGSPKLSKLSCLEG